MTSCLLVKGPRRLVAVADGRLSYGSDSSFETTQKIRRFLPTYRIPKVSMTWFSHYTDFTGDECYVAYAGTYALVSEVLEAFRERISGSLTLVWRDGRPTFSEYFDESTQFIDDYEFSALDLPGIEPKLILDEFRAAAQEKIDEFCRLRRMPADCEFLLFGRGPDRRYFAYKITPDQLWSLNQPVRLNAEPITDGTLAAIGSPEVSGAAFDDRELLQGLRDWNLDETDIAFSDQVPSGWDGDSVAQRFAQLIRAAFDNTVGGGLTVAKGIWHGPIAISSM